MSVMTTTSRMMYAFARYVYSPIELAKVVLRNRDGGLPASNYLAVIHPTLRLPFNALLLTTVMVILFGLIFIGSSR